MKTKYLFLSLLLFSVSLSGCTKLPNGERMEMSDVSSPVTIHTEEQQLILDMEDPDSYMSNQSTVYGNRSWSNPKGIHLSWEEINDEGMKADKYQVYLDESPAFNNPIIYETENNEIDIYNMKINTTYYYTVYAMYKKFGKHYESYANGYKSFTVTDCAPRNINIDGLENVRDLGGWDIGSGRTYKQGLIYRSFQFNYGGGLNTFKYEPTEYGKWQLLNELKIKTDIDLRKTKSFNGDDEVNGITSSPLGKNVKYVSAPMVYANKNIFTYDKNKESIKLVFNTLADSSNYPIVFHCVRGTDRTGALAYVLGALVGMNEEDLMMDYLFSNLAKIGNMVKKSIIEASSFYVQGIANSEGATLSEKTKNYLHNTCDISYEVLDQVISNLVV